MGAPGDMTDRLHFEGREQHTIWITAYDGGFDNFFSGDNNMLAGEAGPFGEPKTSPQARRASGVAALHMHDGDVGN